MEMRALMRLEGASSLERVSGAYGFDVDQKSIGTVGLKPNEVWQVRIRCVAPIGDVLVMLELGHESKRREERTDAHKQQNK
jgi:hypothetical protein